MIPYIGDISKADAQLLSELAEKSENILEFGVGASTQVLAHYGKNLMSIETDNNWIERTKENLKLLGIQKEIVFINYNVFMTSDIPTTYDLIFDDGADEFRLPFAYKTWDKLAVGGYLLFHDTRRGKDVQNIADFIVKHSPEIESVFINKDHSNITVIKKKAAEFYENWNEVEGREPWESGYEPVNIIKLASKIQMHIDTMWGQIYSMINAQEKGELLASQYHDYIMARETIYPDAPEGMGINEFAEWIINK